MVHCEGAVRGRLDARASAHPRVGFFRHDLLAQPYRPKAISGGTSRVPGNRPRAEKKMTIRLQLAALLLFAAGNALAAAPTELPPISRLGSAEHHTGKVIWADL